MLEISFTEQQGCFNVTISNISALNCLVPDLKHCEGIYDRERKRKKRIVIWKTPLTINCSPQEFKLYDQAAVRHLCIFMTH